MEVALTLEQELLLRKYQLDIEKLTKEQAQNLLVDALHQSMLLDNKLKEAMLR